MTFSLVPCDQNGISDQAIPDMSETHVANCQATAELYRRVSFVSLWIGYIAVFNNRGVGSGAFVGSPKDGRVEIAYFTLENEQGQRYASQTVAALVKLARAHAPEIGLKAFTLKEENPSTKILKGIGFSIVGVAEDADAGEVWEWRTTPCSY